MSDGFIEILFKLLPGFFTAWVFYGLTAYKIGSPFERVVQALVFTALVQGLVIAVRYFSLLIGQVVSLGPWTDDGAFVASIAIALLLGLGLAYAGNNSTVHHRLWKWQIANGNSYPSNWYKAFREEKRWIVLHLKDGRRLFGWPSDWPDHEGEGEFVMQEVDWLLDTGEPAPSHRVEMIVIPARDVAMVEFVRYNEEIPAGVDELARSEERLVDARTSRSEGVGDGSRIE